MQLNVMRHSLRQTEENNDHMLSREFVIRSGFEMCISRIEVYSFTAIPPVGKRLGH
jgi:hypothetical protein